MGKIESFFIGSCCFLAGSISHIQTSDLYIVAFAMLIVSIFLCSKYIVKAIEKMKEHKKSKEADNKIKSKDCIVITGGENTIETNKKI
jgi:Na+/H+ antiporter NhaD/arsenite permease-like protein